MNSEKSSFRMTMKIQGTIWLLMLAIGGSQTAHCQGPLPFGATSGTPATASTQQGSTVSYWTQIVSALTAAQKLSYNQQTDQWIFANSVYAVPLTESTRQYNCHGWSILGGAGWLDWSQGSTFISDGSFTLINSGTSNPTAQQQGQYTNKTVVIHYTSADHSAEYLSTVWVESKWGQWPRVYHKVTESPYGSSWKAYEDP